MTVSGSAFLPSTTLTVSIASTPTTLGSVTVSSDGTFSQSFDVPCSVDAGDHTVSATASSGQSASAAVTLTACATTAPAAAAPVTVTPKFTG